MKIDILKNQWIDLVFEGRNKDYGAYELRKENPKVLLVSLFIGSIVFTFLTTIPMMIEMIPNSDVVKENTDTKDYKMVTVKLPPKEEVIKEEPVHQAVLAPPPPSKVDQVKFVKPVVAKASEVTEEPPKVSELKDKKLGTENIKGDPNAQLTVEPIGKGDVNSTGVSNVVTPPVVDNAVYAVSGVEVLPSFPGGMEQFYKFIANNYVMPEEEYLRGRIYVSFVIEKDGSLTDIKIIRDVGFGSGREAVRVLKLSPKWIPGEQNGKKVRVAYSLPITIKSPD